MKARLPKGYNNGGANNIQQLASLFCNEELLDALMAANTPEDILAAEAAYPIEEL